MNRPEFIKSAQAKGNIFHDLDDTRQWLRMLQENGTSRVSEIPLAELDQWYFHPDTGDLKHRSGKFFSIVGLDCKPVWQGATSWQQPIIDQPEVGILGILTKNFDGLRYFLMQAKMEPGNINRVQISPTVQATFSNYTQTHQGRTPAYLAYFLDPNASVIRNQLQSETGTRFYRKFNRNMLIDVSGEVEVLPGFRWLTLYEIQALMALDNAINMDSRSVLSNISCSCAGAHLAAGGTAFFRSASCGPEAASRTETELRDWLSDMRARYRIATHMVPLHSVQGWVRDETGIHHESRNFFKITGLRVEAADREVSGWSQPVLKHQGLGLAGFLCADIGGVLHFLLQAKPEPGIVGSVELAPTVSVFDYQRRAADAGMIPFFEYFLQPRPEDVLHASIQSEEGGRFQNLCNHFLVVMVQDPTAVPRVDRYEWMTLEQLQRFSQGESLVNSEARTLLSCLSYFME